MHKSYGYAFVFSVLICSPTILSAEVKTIMNKTMPFEQCKLLIQVVAKEVGSKPITVFDTKDGRIVRFMTTDGSGDSVLVTCSRLDQKALVTLSTN